MANFALIHGAGDVGWYWHLVVAELRLHGHDTVAPDLPIEDDKAGLTEYAAAVIDAIGDRRDVVVVAQSFGGYVAPIVAERIDARLIVLVAAMVPRHGESAEEMFVNTHWEPAQLEDASELAVFYHDVPRELADEALSRGRRQSDTPGREPWPLAAWPAIETRFIICGNDRFFPAPWLRGVVRDRLGIEPVEIDSGHCPALSHPRELARLLDRYATTGSGSWGVAARGAAIPGRRLAGMSDFSSRLDDFLAELFRLHPTFATAIGQHDHDDRWPDLTDAGRAEQAAFTDRWLSELGAMTDLSPDEVIDRDLLVGELEAGRFADAELREDTWDPLHWVYLVGDGLFTLSAREFAPLADRLASTAGRLERLPAVFDAARARLVGHEGQPVGRFQTETALKQLPGIGALIEEAMANGEAAAPTDPAVAEIQPRLAAAAETARAAVAAFETHLREVVLPASEGEGRLGKDLFATKMRHTMRSETLTPERIMAGAEREYVAVRAEMVRLARQLWATWCDGQPIPDDEGVLVRGVLDAIALEHPKADDLLDFCRAENARIEAFCAETDLIGLADEPLEIRWTPIFLRAFGGAMLSSPGPLDKGQKAFFAITPMPDDWSAEQRESNLREDNDRMLRLLTIHEAVPGHYLQGVYANRCPSIVRAIFASGLFAEGWAVYVTQVMMDVGYGADDPALLLVHWKFYLRSITNAIIDARIHCDGMTEEEAVALMVDGGFQEQAEARAKFDRARLSSTQLSTYFAGSLEMWDIEREVRRRAAIASGAEGGAGAVPDPRVVGGFGETPGFRYRPHLESVLAHGAPPTSLLRRILLG